MSAKIIFESPAAIMWFHPESKIIHHKINSYLHGQEFRDFMMLGTHTMAEKSAHKWLSDDQTVVVVDKEDMDWGSKNWFLDTVAAGWKYWAIVKPIKLIGQLDLEKLAKDYGSQGIETKFFTNFDEALNWLESK